LDSGSAMGYNGAHRGDELLDEESASGSDYLAQTARDWEQATSPATDAGIRVVVSRTGLVLGTDGGALVRMLPPFKLGVGGRLGSGKQWMSWIALDDVVRALRFLMDSADLRGPVNLAAPTPVRNIEFTETLARVLGRRAVLPVPSFALELLFGSMADNTLLASQRMVPKRLAGAGFEFRHPRLEDALRYELRR
ncbi:MAG: TIGR01777 family oxidoreductase, partial [Gemmatimonadaceae bacterium]